MLTPVMVHSSALVRPSQLAARSITSLLFEPTTSFPSILSLCTQAHGGTSSSGQSEPSMPDSTETSGKCLEDVDSSHSRKPGSHQHSADVDDELTHVDSAGRASMVNIGGKDVTERYALAAGTVYLGPAAYELVKENKMKKGDVLTVAQLAGIIGAKQTSQLIPLCHNIPLTRVKVWLELDQSASGVLIHAEAHTIGQTGVEMEAMTAVSVAALTVYDMCKAIAREAEICSIHLVRKTGGKSGEYSRRKGVK